MLNSKNISSGIVAALMACTSGAALIIQSADSLGLSRAEAVSWLFAVYVMGGGLNLLLNLLYKVPFAGCQSITAAAFLSASAAHYPLAELAGSFVMTGAIIALLGLTGLFGKVLALIPKPMIDAMLAGIVLHYVVGIVPAIKQLPLVGCLSLLGFIMVPKLIKGVPPLLGMLVLGLIGLAVTYEFPAIGHTEFMLPHWITPVFTGSGFISLAVPIAILILSNDVAVALSALKKNGYQPPVNRTIVWSGLGTLAVGFFGGHAVTVGGMMTTVCSSEEAGKREHRIWASVVCGVLVTLFGLFAWGLIAVILALPSAFVALVCGFSLVGVLIGSLQSVFSEPSYRYSTLFAFAIAIANVTFFGVSSPVWALLIGTVTMLVLKEGSAAGQRGQQNGDMSGTLKER
jgi:benzoate membrane transport protein